MTKSKIRKIAATCLFFGVVGILGGCNNTESKEKSKKEETVTYFNSLKEAKASEGINAMTSSYDEMVEYLESKGYISKDTTPVDINETKGYLVDNTGGNFPDTIVADKAFDYDGMWLFWWDQVEKTTNYETYASIKNNSGIIVLGGGAAILETSAANGSFAIAFSNDYAKKDEAVKDFKAIDNKAEALPYLTSAVDLAKLLKEKGLIADISKYDDLESSADVSFAETSFKYPEGITIFYLGVVPVGAGYANYEDLENGGDTITGYKLDAEGNGKWYSEASPDYKSYLTKTEETYHIDAYYAGFAISIDDGEK